MHYEYLFWSMAAMVAAALAGGALCGRLRTVKQLLIGLVAWSVAIFVAVLVLARQGDSMSWRRCCRSPPSCSVW